MSTRATIKGLIAIGQSVAPILAAGTYDVDCAGGNLLVATLAGDVVFRIRELKPGHDVALQLTQDAAGNRSVTFAASSGPGVASISAASPGDLLVPPTPGATVTMKLTGTSPTGISGTVTTRAGAVVAAPGTYTPPLVVTDALYAPVGTNAGPFVLALAPTGSGHVEGATVCIVLSPGQWTGITFAADANAAGDGVLTTQATGNAGGSTVSDFDAAATYTIWVTYARGFFSTVFRKQPAKDVAAPTIVTAFIYPPALNVLELQTSERLFVPNLTGFALTDTPTGRSIASHDAATQGTDLPKFPLSGAVGGADVVNVVVSATRTQQDLNGNRLAVGSTIVIVSPRPKDMPGCVLDAMTIAASEVTLAGANVDAFADRSVSVASILGTLSPVKPTWIADTGDGTGAIAISCTTTNTGVQGLQILSSPVSPAANFSLFFLVKGLTSAFASYWFSQGRSGSGTWTRLAHDPITSGGLIGWDVDGTFPDGGGANQIAMPVNTWCLMHWYRNSGVWGLENVATGAKYEAAVVAAHPSAALDWLTIGAWATNSGFLNGSKIQLKSVSGFSSYQGATQKAQVRSILRSRFTDCP